MQFAMAGLGRFWPDFWPPTLFVDRGAPRATPRRLRIMLNVEEFNRPTPSVVFLESRVYAPLLPMGNWQNFGPV